MPKKIKPKHRRDVPVDSPPDVKHDTRAHVVAGGFGIPAKGCAVCESSRKASSR